MPICDMCEIDSVNLTLREDSYRRYNNVCELCTNKYYRNCSDCSGVFHRYFSGGSDTLGRLVCNSCAENYFHCYTCNTTLDIEDRHSGEVCISCNIKQENALIKRYNFTPKELKFHGKSPFYMGVELEVECVNLDEYDSEEDCVEYNAKKVIDILGDFVYLKQDGSLSNGFEIVTHPATLHQHKGLWKEFLDNTPSDLISFNSDNCGLHIHASRKHLAEITVAKIVVFVNANMNRRFITRLAQRTSEDYAQFKHKTITNYFSEDKYEAVNLIPENTIEFRMFKGTLKKESVYRALEFVDGIIKYCSNNPIERCVSYKEFIDYVAIQKRFYPELNKFCVAFNELAPLTTSAY